MDEPVRVAVRSLKIGDVWITQNGRKRARIVEIEPLRLSGPDGTKEQESNAFTFWISIPGHKNNYPYHKGEHDTVLSEIPGVCDAGCCDSCAREVAEDRHYCPAHWNAWQEVA